MSGIGIGSGTPIINAWTPFTSYPPGAGVRPTSSPGSLPTQPTNGDFETGGLASWTAGAGWSASTADFYNGTHSAKLAAGSGTVELLNNLVVAVVPGQKIDLQCFFNRNSSAATLTMGIHYYTSANAGAGGGIGGTGWISKDTGDIAPSNVVGLSWNRYVCNGVAPANAAYAQISSQCINGTLNDVYVDAFSWNYLAPNAPSTQVFYAVQAGTGKSGASEPVWAATPPNIIDGTVEWSSQAPTSLTWRANALMISANAEPTWPDYPGQMVHDNNMDWVAISPVIADANCPQSKYVFIAASKIFALDNDRAAYSATLDPTDWTTELDAGFLPIGQRAYGSNPFVAAGLYRGNGVFFNAEGMQMWQLDEDPANMAMLDALPINCTRHRTLAPVNDDLFFLSAEGDRTLGISAGTANMMSGDVGMPMDTIIKAAMVWADAHGVTVLGAYFPSTGQRWLAVPNWDATGYLYDAGGTNTTRVFVYTMNRKGEVGAWSTYLFNLVIQDFCQSGDVLYMRATQASGAEAVFSIDTTSGRLVDGFASSVTAAHTATVQWPWLDCGQPGQNKDFEGFDTVVNLNVAGTYTISFGYNQNDKTAFTTPFSLSGDTLPGMTYPLQIKAPSMSVRLRLTSSTDWEIQLMNLYVADDTLTT